MAKSGSTGARGKPGNSEERVERVICRNRRAAHEYEILETLEVGMVLTGTEVKSLRAGRANLEEAYARVESDEVWLYRAEIPEYAMGNRMNHEPRRKRKLLLHRREIGKFAKAADQAGHTLIPLRLYFAGSRAKIQLALVKGKKEFDKRESIKEKTAKREMERATGTRRGHR